MSSFFIDLYVRVDQRRVRISSAQDHITTDERAKVALVESGVAVAAGNSAEGVPPELIREYEQKHKLSVSMIEPFNHPRLAIDDLFAAQRLLWFCISKHLLQSGRSLFALRLRRVRLVVHPTHSFTGGLTHIEAKAIYDVVQSITHSRVHVWSGRELYLNEVAALQFPSEGRVFGRRDFTNNARGSYRIMWK